MCIADVVVGIAAATLSTAVATPNICSCQLEHHSCNSKHCSCLQSSPLQDAFTAQFGIRPQLVPGIVIRHFLDIDGSCFVGVVTRDTSSSHPDMVRRWVEEMPNAARGAEDRAQHPSMEELAAFVTLARDRGHGLGGRVSQASSATPAAAQSDMPAIGNHNVDAKEVHIEEPSHVPGKSLAVGSAGQARQLPQARNPARRQRQGSASLNSSDHGSHGRGSERLDGSSSCSWGDLSDDNIQAQIDKLSIYDILKFNINRISKMSIYNAVRHSAMRSPFTCQHHLVVLYIDRAYMLLLTPHIAEV